MEQTAPTLEPTDIWKAAKEILETIERDREREIVSRRFGLYDRKETLEQIGELLGITRERVRQLEKSVVSRLKASAEKDLPHIKEVEKAFIEHLKDMGNVARVKDLSAKVSKENTPRDQAHVAFLSELAPNLSVVSENDDFHHSVGITEHHDQDNIKALAEEIVAFIKEHGKPAEIQTVSKGIGKHGAEHTEALAKTSKHLATLRGQWGLTKWPTVNPKNIRDKIYVVLQEKHEPMHFSEIAKAIRDSDFKRRDVTVQAIHNELIKDSRFVLIGRGIYALKEWGYKKGTVADIITEVLKKEGAPLHRDEIVKRVLKFRQVKETTILLNLQGKPQFKRVAKATYDVAA
jgi:DNA-directed RNA polymerase delta subunit